MFKELFGGGETSRLVKAAYADFSSMLQQSGRMMDEAVAVLLDGKEPTVDLEEMDDVVDEGERMIRRTILQHLSVSPKQDLVASLVLISMVQDAERVGDFARGLAELRSLARHPIEGPFADELRIRAREVRGSFETCERAFERGEAELGREVIRQHTRTKADLLELTRRIAASDLPADMAIVYASAARILRRISAHLSNVASAVVQPFDRVRHGDDSV